MMPSGDPQAGDKRTFALLGAFLFLTSAATTVLSAAKNGLFLSIYSSRLIPQAVISAALLTAVIALLFTGIATRLSRRVVTVGLLLFLGMSLLGGYFLFESRPRSAFFLFLWLSMTQALVATQAWDFTRSMFTGRQAKRMLPLLGIAASLGAILSGFAVARLARILGTSILLILAAALMAGALGFPLLLREPGSATVADSPGERVLRAFFRGASEGFRAIARQPLLRVMAAGTVTIALAGALIDLQLKFAVHDAFGRDGITALYGIIAGVTGICTLLLQILSSRVLLPRLGVSFTAMFQAGAESVVALVAALTGGIVPFAGLQITGDVLQFSVQRPVEQVSLLPYARRQKSAAVTTLGGVLRPLSKAAGGGIALMLLTHPTLLRWVILAAVVAALIIYTRHRRAYLVALDGALARRAVELVTTDNTPLVVNREALSVIDRGLADDDPGVVVFCVSLLDQLPAGDAFPRVVKLLSHGSTEVRAEAAHVLGKMRVEGDGGILREAVSRRLSVEPSPFALAALLHAAGVHRHLDIPSLIRFVDHPDPSLLKEALIALGIAGWDGLTERLKEKLASSRSVERIAAAGAAGELGRVDLIPELAAAVEDSESRSAVLEALATLGEASVDALLRLLGRRDLPLSLRRSVITVLERIGGQISRRTLVELLDEPALGPAALTSLCRMRRARGIPAVDPAKLRPLILEEIRKGSRYALAASTVGERDSSEPSKFIAHEILGLAHRAAQRVFKMLALSYDEGRLAAVESALRGPDPTMRSNALELMEGMLAGEDAGAVISFAEASAEGFLPGRMKALREDSDEILSRPFESLLEDSDWWPRALACHALGRDDEVGLPGRSPASNHGGSVVIPLIEKVMILKGTELFREFPGSDLASVASLAEELHLDAHEEVFEQGAEGDAFYIIVSGRVRIMRGTHELALLGAREGFGEMAILDQETRSATASAAEATTLLKIDRDSFDRLVEQNPAVARGIYRVLTRRLRNTLAQVAKG